MSVFMESSKGKVKMFSRLYVALNMLISSVLFVFCNSVHCNPQTQLFGYRTLKLISCFGSINGGAWENKGILGKYNLRYIPTVADGCDNTESLLGFCRSFFLYSARLDSAQQLRWENISGDALRALYHRNVKSIQADLNVSNEKAQKLAFVTCFDTSWHECIDALNSVLGNGRNRRSMGISHKYSLEDAYVILHMHPNVYFWHYFTSPSEDMELYVNAIAGALNTIMNSNAIILDEHFNRQTVLKLIVREYFDKFILQSKTKS